MITRLRLSDGTRRPFPFGAPNEDEYAAGPRLARSFTIFTLCWQCFPGPTGFTGSSGDKGDFGEQGRVGPPGDKGEAGFPGLKVQYAKGNVILPPLSKNQGVTTF